MLKSLCAGRLEVLERSSFDEVPSVFVFAIWADFSFFSFMCAEMCRNSSIYADFYQKKPLETLLWNEFLDTEGTSVQPYFKYKPVIEVLRHKPRANSSNLDEICKCLLCVCVFFLPHWNQNRILDHSWYVNALTKCLAFVAMERRPAAMNAVAPVGPVRAVNSVTFARQSNRLEVFFNFYERYIDEIGKPFDEFHLHEKKLYIHIDIAVQNKYIKQSCEGQTDGFIQKFCLPFRLQQTEKRALCISCCLPSCPLKISDQCAWAHQANSASAQTTSGGHRWAKKAVPWPKEMTRESREGRSWQPVFHFCVCVFCVSVSHFVWTSRGLDSDSCNCSTCVPRQKGQPRSLGLCRCFCQGQDLFLEGPLGASLCATSLCSLLCVHSSSSALARGNGQQLGVRRFFSQSHHWHHHHHHDPPHFSSSSQNKITKTTHFIRKCLEMITADVFAEFPVQAGMPEDFVLALAFAVAEISWLLGSGGRAETDQTSKVF